MMVRVLALGAALMTFTLPAVAVASSHTGATAGGAMMPSCSKNDPVVWINTKSHVYHPKGDKYFGKTKAGEYACTSKAAALGAHPAGGKPGKAAPSVDAPDDDADAPAVTTSQHKKKHVPHTSSDAGGGSTMGGG